MYFVYQGEKYCINCDWLQYSVMMDRTNPKFNCPPSYRIDLCQGNNIYEHRALVFDQHGRKLLTLLWSPYSSILNPLVMTVQIANESLYSGWILKSHELLRSILPCYFNSVGRFDVCCDFDMNSSRLNIVKHLNSGHYYVERKTEGSGFWHEVEQNGFKHKQTHCISWGSKTSEIKVKLYNKARELGTMNGNEAEKPWIVKEWEEIGIDKTQAWRLEFSLKSNGQLKWNDNPIRLDNIASPSWLMRVYFDLYGSRFVTRVNQGKKQGHKNNDKRVYLINLPSDGEKLNWAATDNHRTEAEPAVQLLRSMLRNLDNEALKADKQLFEHYTTNICEVVNSHNLSEYFERSFGQPANQFFATMADNMGSGINEQTVAISKLID